MKCKTDNADSSRQAKATAAQPEPVKLADNSLLANRRIDRAREIAKMANKLKPLFEELKIGEFTAYDLQDAMTTGGQDARERYVKVARRYAESIPVGMIRCKVMDDAKLWRTPYAKEAENVRRMTGGGGVGGLDTYLTRFVTQGGDGCFAVTEEDAARIADDAATWLTDPREIAKYLQHVAAVEALNAFFENGKGTPPHPLGWVSFFRIDSKGHFSLPDPAIDYADMIGYLNAGEKPEKAVPIPPDPTTVREPQPRTNRAGKGTMTVTTAPVRVYTGTGDPTRDAEMKKYMTQE